MIRLTRLNGDEVFVNADLIATVESHHDTVVTLVDGRTYVVTEPATEVVVAVTRYRATILAFAEQIVIEPEPEPEQVSQTHLRVLRSDAGVE